jgi:hypothetical protein
MEQRFQLFVRQQGGANVFLHFGQKNTERITISLTFFLNTYVRHNASHLATLQQIRARFNTAEEINNGETTAPSKRLQRLYASYDKILFGPLIVQRVGLDVLRQECPHFHAWVSKLEALSDGEHSSA